MSREVVRKRKKKRKLKVKRLVIVLIIFILLIVGLIKIISKTKDVLITNTYYMASNTNNVLLYSYDEENETLNDVDKIVRGSEVTSNDKIKVINDLEYLKIKYNDKEYYVLNDNVVKNKKDVVLEKEKYVRTSVTVYENNEDAKIESFIKKGNKLDILDYDKIDDNGFVNMYKIKIDDISGWVYSKYLVDTLEEAKEVYNENGVYDTHKDRKYSRELYGGKASSLDYYPYNKPNFNDNKLLEKANAIYLMVVLLRMLIHILIWLRILVLMLWLLILRMVFLLMIRMWHVNILLRRIKTL